MLKGLENCSPPGKIHYLPNLAVFIPSIPVKLLPETSIVNLDAPKTFQFKEQKWYLSEDYKTIPTSLVYYQEPFFSGNDFQQGLWQ